MKEFDYIDYHIPDITLTSLYYHFKLLNTTPDDNLHITDNTTYSDINQNREINKKFNLTEIKASVRKLQLCIMFLLLVMYYVLIIFNNKSPGTDGIINEFLKHAHDNF